jgi:hypothetical protein
MCIPIAFLVGDYHAVRDLTALAERMRIKNLPDVLETRIKAENAIGNITGELTTAERLLKLDPKNEVALTHRTRALKDLQEVVRLAGGK